MKKYYLFFILIFIYSYSTNTKTTINKKTKLRDLASIKIFTCNKDFNDLNEQMLTIKQNANKYIQNLTKEDILLELDKKDNDSPIILIAITWPELLKEKINLEGLYDDIVNPHKILREAFLEKRSKEEIKKAIETWHIALSAFYNEDIPLIIQKLENCYNKFLSKLKK